MANEAKGEMTKAASTTLAKAAPLDVKEQYPLLVDGQEVIERLGTNLEGETISIKDLSVIKVPSGGVTNWEIPTIRGAVAQKTVDGIILGFNKRRAFWKDPNPSSNPPDCASKDLVTGIGDNGTGVGIHECANCPMAQFGSAIGPDGKPRKGQRCRENKLISMLIPDEQMPVILKVPPSSLDIVRGYQVKLPVAYYACVSSFGLVSDKTDDGVKYSRIVPAYLGRLPPEQAALVKGYAEVIKGTMSEAADAVNSQNDVEKPQE